MVRKNITAIDVAKLAGVSQPTVSRVFNKGANVSEDKRRRVLEAAEKLGYQPNALARGLTTNKTNIIGIVMRDIQNPFYPEVLERFHTELIKHGYHLLFVNSDNELIKDEDVKDVIGYNIDGVIITDAKLSSSATTRLIQNKMVVVLFNRYTKKGDYSAIYCDNYNAGFEIGKYLLKTKHRNLAFISGPYDTSTSNERQKGFQDAIMRENNAQFHLENGNYTYEGGYDAAIRLFKRHRDIDAIFCANDITAIGAIDGLRSIGYRVPDDVSVVGFDDIKMSNWHNYSLTTWKQPLEEMVKLTVHTLLEEIERKDEKKSFKPLKGELVIRNSVKDRTVV